MPISNFDLSRYLRNWIALFVSFLIVKSAFGAVSGSPEPLVQPLRETAKKHEGKHVLVIFTARWDLSGEILKKLMEDEEVGAVLLRSEGVIAYVADCTDGGSVGATEMREHGVNATPYSAALLHPDGMITFTRLDLSSAKALAHRLRSLIDKGRGSMSVDDNKPPK